MKNVKGSKKITQNKGNIVDEMNILLEPIDKKHDIISYGWVLVGLWFILRIANSISLTAFPLAIPFISKEYHLKTDSLFLLMGVFAYSFSLWIVFFFNFKGWMNTRVKLAVLISQIALIGGTVLIPIAGSYEQIIFYRFIQGLWFMELGLCAISFAGWFKSHSLAMSIGVPLAALQFGSAVGGLIGRYIVLATSWQDGFFAAAGIASLATVVFFILYRDAPGYHEHVIKDRLEHIVKGSVGDHSLSVWKWPATYTIGISQNATTMLFASVPFIVPIYGYSLHMSKIIVADTVTAYGIISGSMIVFGAIYGGIIIKTKNTTRQKFIARNSTRNIAHIMALIGLLLLIYDRSIFGYVTGSILISCILFNIPNYWAELTEIVPSGYRGDFIYSAGTVASFGFLGGPFMVIMILHYYHSYTIVWVSFIFIIAISQIANSWQGARVPLPLEEVEFTLSELARDECVEFPSI